MNRLVWRIVAAMLLVVALAISVVPLAQRVAQWRTLAALPPDFQDRLQREMHPPPRPREQREQTGEEAEAGPGFFEAESRRLFDLFAEQRRAQDQAIVIGLALAVAIAVLLAVLLARNLVGPLGVVSRTVNRLAAGDRSVRVPAPAGRWTEEVGQLARDFNAMADALERYEAGRQAMLADTAHELRNPIAALQLRLEAMSDGIVPPSEEEFAVLRGNVALLTRLVQDLRTLSLAESHHLDLQLEPIDLAELVGDAVAMFAPLAAGKGVRLVVEAAPAPVRGDVVRLQQVLMNLLDNGLAASPEGGVLSVTVAASGGEARLTVRDQGPGMPEGELESVFERFVQGARVDSRDGSGLGLAIVKAIVSLHGGAVSAASTGVAGEGVALTVTLPSAA